MRITPNLRRLALSAATFLTIPSAHAGVSPLGFAILAPAQFPPRGFSVAGARVSAIWGDHRDVWGFDFAAIGNMTETSFGGLAVSGVFNWNKGVATVVGLQAAGVANVNVNKARIIGLQVALGLNSNRAESTLAGLQVALGNASEFTTVYGAQIGAYNSARAVYGFQIGLVNSTGSLHGIQLGLLNFNHTGLFSVAPLMNIGF